MITNANVIVSTLNSMTSNAKGVIGYKLEGCPIRWVTDQGEDFITLYGRAHVDPNGLVESFARTLAQYGERARAALATFSAYGLETLIPAHDIASLKRMAEFDLLPEIRSINVGSKEPTVGDAVALMLQPYEGEL